MSKGAEPTVVLHRVFRDISNLGTVLDDSKTLESRLKTVSVIDVSKIDKIFDDTNDIVISLHSCVSDINKYFLEHYKAWKMRKRTDEKKIKNVTVIIEKIKNFHTNKSESETEKGESANEKDDLENNSKVQETAGSDELLDDIETSVPEASSLNNSNITTSGKLQETITDVQDDIIESSITESSEITAQPAKEIVTDVTENNKSGCDLQNKTQINEANEECNDNELIQNTDQEKPKIGLIKVIDINKLRDPKTNNTHSNDSDVVIISDTEEAKINKSKKQRIRSNRRITRRRRNYKECSEDSDSDNNVKLPSSLRLRQRKSNLRKKVSFECNSESSSSSVSNSASDNFKIKKTKGQNNRHSAAPKTIKQLLDIQSDKKFSWQAYVKLPYIKCEELMERYVKTLEDNEIKRLTNLDSLKRTHHERKDSQDSSSSSGSVKHKTKRICEIESTKSKLENKTSPDNESNFSSDNDSNNLLNDDETSLKSPKNDAVADILHSLASSEDESVKSSGENNENVTEKHKKAKNDSTSKNDGKDKDKIDEENDNKNLDKTSNGDKSETDDSDGNQKKQWKRAKLLTSKLSDSDGSDEKNKKFRDKKEKLNEKNSDADDSFVTVKRTTKKRIRHRIGSDSDSESDATESDKKSSSSESEDTTKKKPVRRRIKRVKDSSSDEGEDKKTRKNIRRVLARESLAETTKIAEKEESERKARIAERQKKYNTINDTELQINATVDKVVLDFNEETREELLKIDDEIVKKLKPHQAAGVQFMWNACYESLERAKNTKGSGCILAHCMGLGKTLQVIALTHTLLANNEKTNVLKVLVVCPLNTVLNWVSEFKHWLPEDDDMVNVFEMVSYKQNYERKYQAEEWDRCGGVLIIGYEMFRNLTNMENKRISKKLRTVFQKTLVDPGPDLVVCDEGHLLKNEKTSLSIAMNRLKTLRRIVLTGTPLQNNLKEYWCMVQFVKPNLLGTYKEYLNRFVNPITNGQYTDSTPRDIQVMRKRSHVLHKLLDGIVQRRDYQVLAPYLPPKHEYVLFITLTETQIKLYQHYMNEFARKPSEDNKIGRTSFLFNDFQEFQRICTHPHVLLDKSIKLKIAKDNLFDDEEESEGSIKDFIDDAENSSSDTSSNSSSENNELSDSNKNTKVQTKRLTRANAVLAGGLENVVVEEEEKVEEPPEWWRCYCDGEELDNIVNGSKLFVLFEILKQCEQIGDKVLVFSQSLYSLNVIEHFLAKVDEGTQNGKHFNGYTGSWSLGLDYFRLDGSSSCDNRAAWCRSFNSEDNIRARLFLISTRAGGLGINLVAANRVVIFDVSWNPSHDIQSIYRVYRFGQTKPCYIYRFVTQGTMEMKIYERQVTKQAISKRVIDEQQIDRHYNQDDLAELYKFDPKPEERPTPLVPKDVLLAELLQSLEAFIYKYHEHQSLLENKEDEVLDEAERKAAWEEFELEKTARRYDMGTINDVPYQSVTLGVASILRKANPSWNNMQIQSVIPTVVEQMKAELANGQSLLFDQVVQEITKIQQLQNQRMQEYYMLQKAMQAFQQDGNVNLPAQFLQRWQNNPNLHVNRVTAHGAGSSRSTPPIQPNEIIELND